MTMGELIHVKRTERGMTLEDVGSAIGVGRSTVRRWETGLIRSMSVDNALKISRVLNIDMRLLNHAENDYDISEAYRRANSRTKKAIRILLGLE